MRIWNDESPEKEHLEGGQGRRSFQRKHYLKEAKEGQNPQRRHSLKKARE
jgi:hypothetical protein